MGLSTEDLSVSMEVLRDDYIIQVALLDPGAEKEIEEHFITPYMKVDHRLRVPTIEDTLGLLTLTKK